MWIKCKFVLYIRWFIVWVGNDDKVGKRLVIGIMRVKFYIVLCVRFSVLYEIFYLNFIRILWI